MRACFKTAQTEYFTTGYTREAEQSTWDLVYLFQGLKGKGLQGLLEPWEPDCIRDRSGEPRPPWLGVKSVGLSGISLRLASAAYQADISQHGLLAKVRRGVCAMLRKWHCMACDCTWKETLLIKQMWLNSCSYGHRMWIELAWPQRVSTQDK